MSTGTRDDGAGLHPLARNLWGQLRDLGEVDRRFVFSALQRRLSPNVQLSNQEIAVAALQRFDAVRRRAAASTAADELPGWARGTLSKRAYNAYRDAQADRSSLPSTTLIANAFARRWGDAVAAAGLGAASDVLAGRGLARARRSEPPR